jgi:hypothetical protein
MAVRRSKASIEQEMERYLDDQQMRKEDRSDGKYKGYKHQSPFSRLQYFDSYGSILIDAMHAFSNIIGHIINIPSGSNISRIESKKLDGLDIKQEELNDFEQRKEELLANLKAWKFKEEIGRRGRPAEDMRHVISARYNRLIGPNSFIERNNGPYDIGKDGCLFN